MVSLNPLRLFGLIGREASATERLAAHTAEFGRLSNIPVATRTAEQVAQMADLERSINALRTGIGNVTPVARTWADTFRTARRLTFGTLVVAGGAVLATGYVMQRREHADMETPFELEVVVPDGSRNGKKTRAQVSLVDGGVDIDPQTREVTGIALRGSDGAMYEVLHNPERPNFKLTVSSMPPRPEELRQKIINAVRNGDLAVVQKIDARGTEVARPAAYERYEAVGDRGSLSSGLRQNAGVVGGVVGGALGALGFAKHWLLGIFTTAGGAIAGAAIANAAAGNSNNDLLGSLRPGSTPASGAGAARAGGAGAGRPGAGGTGGTSPT